MVFVWSHLTKGDPAYTLVQVSVNDFIVLVLVARASSLSVPFQVLLCSVVAFIVIPLTAGTVVYLNSSLAYGMMKVLKVEHSVAAPGALIGASNFFELAVATAIALYGPESGAALATVVGVLVEIPVMLSVCAACNRTQHWFSLPSEP